ncbi:hypothetical protein C8R42DRAFT_717377 [Lentinula raphanica]|nr:hypothetical protein C8R42DRAFT_717377 [Lentinula raphanica]
MNDNFEVDPGPQQFPTVYAGQKRTRLHPHSVANGLDDVDRFPASKRLKPFVKRFIQARRHNRNVMKEAKRPIADRPYNINLAPPKQSYPPVSASGPNLVAQNHLIHASMYQDQVLGDLYGRETYSTAHTHIPQQQQPESATPNFRDTIIPPVEQPLNPPKSSLRDDSATSNPLSPPIPCHEYTTPPCSTSSNRLPLRADYVTTDEFGDRELLDETVGAGALLGSEIDDSHADVEALSDHFGQERNAVGTSISANQGPSAFEELVSFETPSQDVYVAATHVDDLVESQGMIDENGCHAALALVGRDMETLDEYHYGHSGGFQPEELLTSETDGGIDELKAKIPSYPLADCLTHENADELGEEGIRINSSSESQAVDQDEYKAALSGGDSETLDEYHYGYVVGIQVAEIYSSHTDGELEEINGSTSGNVDDVGGEWLEGLEVCGVGTEHEGHIATSSMSSMMGSVSDNSGTVTFESSSHLDYLDIGDGAEESGKIDLENALYHYGDTGHTVVDKLQDMSSTPAPHSFSLENPHLFRMSRDSEILADGHPDYQLTAGLPEHNGEPTDTYDGQYVEPNHGYDSDEQWISSYALPLENTFPSFGEQFADHAPRVLNDINPYSSCNTDDNEGRKYGIVDATDSAPTRFTVNEEGILDRGVVPETHISVLSMPTSNEVITELEMTVPPQSFASYSGSDVCRGAVEHESHTVASSLFNMGSVRDDLEAANYQPSSQLDDFGINDGAEDKGGIDLHSVLDQYGYEAVHTTVNELPLEVSSAPISQLQALSEHSQLFHLSQDVQDLLHDSHGHHEGSQLTLGVGLSPSQAPSEYSQFLHSSLDAEDLCHDGHGYHEESQPKLGLSDQHNTESMDTMNDPYAVSSQDDDGELLISFSPSLEAMPLAPIAASFSSPVNVFNDNEVYSTCNLDDEQGWAYGIAEAADAASSAFKVEEEERVLSATLGLEHGTHSLDHTCTTGHVDQVQVPDDSLNAMPLSPLSENSHLFHISPYDSEDYGHASYHVEFQLPPQLSDDRGEEAMDTNDDPYASPNYVYNDEQLTVELPPALVENPFASVWSDSTYHAFNDVDPYSYALPNQTDDNEQSLDSLPSAPVENPFPSVWNDSHYCTLNDTDPYSYQACDDGIAEATDATKASLQVEEDSDHNAVMLESLGHIDHFVGHTVYHHQRPANELPSDMLVDIDVLHLNGNRFGDGNGSPMNHDHAGAGSFSSQHPSAGFSAPLQSPSPQTDFTIFSHHESQNNDARSNSKPSVSQRRNRVTIEEIPDPDARPDPLNNLTSDGPILLPVSDTSENSGYGEDYDCMEGNRGHYPNSHSQTSRNNYSKLDDHGDQIDESMARNNLPYLGVNTSGAFSEPEPTNDKYIRGLSPLTEIPNTPPPRTHSLPHVNEALSNLKGELLSLIQNGVKSPSMKTHFRSQMDLPNVDLETLQGILDRCYHYVGAYPKRTTPSGAHPAHESDDGHISADSGPRTKLYKPPKHRTEGKNRLAELVRRETGFLLGTLILDETLAEPVVSTDKSLFTVSQGTLRDFKNKIHKGPTIENFVLQLDGGKRTRWNKDAAEAFCKYFRSREGFEGYQRKDIYEAFMGHITQLKRAYERQGNAKSSQEKEDDQRARRLARRQTLLQRRMDMFARIYHYHKGPLGELAQFIRRLTLECMSGDETGSDGKFYKTPVQWRSQELTDFLNLLSAWYMSERYLGGGKYSPGELPRPRYSSNRVDRVLQPDAATSQLPTNWYNPLWLTEYQERQNVLSPLPAVSLKLPDSITREAKRFLQVRFRSDLPLPTNHPLLN